LEDVIKGDNHGRFDGGGVSGRKKKKGKVLLGIDGEKTGFPSCGRLGAKRKRERRESNILKEGKKTGRGEREDGKSLSPLESGR